MTTLTVANSHGIDPEIVATALADYLRTLVRHHVDNNARAVFTTTASIERVEEAAECLMVHGGWWVR